MRVLGISLYNSGKVLNGLRVIVDHLMRLGPFVHVAHITLIPLNAPRKRPDRLLKLLYATVSQPDVVVDVSLVIDEWLVLEAGLEVLEALFVVFIREVCQAQAVED